MPKNEDGEFELVVGNKQLLSIVFILMVLFGVVFSMGYFLGRANTGEQARADASGQVGQAGRPDATGALVPRSQEDSPLQPGEAKVATPDAGTGSTTPLSTTPVASESAPPPDTVAPAAAAPQRETPKPVPAAAVRPPEPAPRTVPAAQSPAAASPAASSPAAASGSPSPGQTFLQVAAVKKPQAQMLLDLLKAKGFHATMVQVDGQEVYRTLVGPVKDAGDLARTKAGLEGAGFKPFVKKY